MQPRDKAAGLEDNTSQGKENWEEEIDAFVFVIQHGHLDVRCKPAMGLFGNFAYSNYKILVYWSC